MSWPSPAYRDEFSHLGPSFGRPSPDLRGEILHYEKSRRTALDLYRNAIVHYLVAPSFMARLLLTGVRLGEFRDELASWLDLFYSEFFTPRNVVLAVKFRS